MIEADRKVLSVSEITRDIRFLLEQQFGGVWIEGEVSTFKFHTSGHMYFTLKDEYAQLQCVMFRSDNAKLEFDIKDGLSVLCFGRISVYPIRGQYQLYVERVEPKGLGALQLRFQALKEKLKQEGLFDEARKRPIPFLPSRIGVVTSLDGAALRDILHVIDRRFGAGKILIVPVPVQGAGAAEAIAEAIQDLNSLHAVEVMIVGRGGGSLEDLWAFNEEVLARAIFNSDIPVISAVGHEVDFTIADFVADLRAATPSAAAEIVLPKKDEILLRLAVLRMRVGQVFYSGLKQRQQTLKALKENKVLRDPLAIFENQAQRLDELKKMLSLLWNNFADTQRERCRSLIHRLEALGPANILKRGFSVTLKEPEAVVVKSVNQLKCGDLIKTKLQQGMFISQVKEIIE